MFRIVFSRAMLFPWLGIALMAVGAAFPAGSVAGMVLVVIGANVGFYALRDFSQSFHWGADARPMLNLCGVVFLLGLALVAAATLFEGPNRWLASLCTGLYLCLFAVWTVPQPLSWPYRLLAVAAAVVMIVGGIFAYLAWQDWRVFVESEETPQEITLSELQRNGFGRNRYIRLKEFRFCDRLVAEKPDEEARVSDLWVPLVAVDGQAVKKDGPAPSVPARIETVAAVLTLGNPGVGKPGLGGLDPFHLLRKRREEEGYECTVVTGIKKLDPEVQQQLREWAPQTDFTQVVVLDWRRPGSAGRVYGFLGGGGAGLLLGLSVLGLIYHHARRAVGVEGWSPPVEEMDEESVPGQDNPPTAEPGTASNPDKA